MSPIHIHYVLHWAPLPSGFKVFGDRPSLVKLKQMMFVYFFPSIVFSWFLVFRQQKPRKCNKRRATSVWVWLRSVVCNANDILQKVVTRHATVCDLSRPIVNQLPFSATMPCCLCDFKNLTLFVHFCFHLFPENNWACQYLHSMVDRGQLQPAAAPPRQLALVKSLLSSFHQNSCLVEPQLATGKVENPVVGRD